jgi:hypothetical protein
MIDDLKTQEKKATAKYANHAKKEADRGVPFAYLAYFAAESLCLVSEVTLGPLCPGGEDPYETNPILRLRIADCAKQSQFPAPGGTEPAGRGAVLRNKPNWPRRAPERARVPGDRDGETRKTNPIRRRRAIVSNKPNPAGRPEPQRAKCAKQTQFPPRRVGGANRSCQTKPIPSAGRKSQVLAGKRVMVDWTCTGLRRNKAN